MVHIFPRLKKSISGAVTFEGGALRLNDSAEFAKQSGSKYYTASFDGTAVFEDKILSFL